MQRPQKPTLVPFRPICWCFPWSNFWRFSPGFGANRIKVGLLVLSQAVPPESTVGTWKIPVSAKVPRFAPWSNFWRFYPDCKSRALLRLGFCANRIKVGLLVLLQAVPPESTVGTWKIPALAKVPRFAPWSNFWRFSPDCLGLVPTASKSVCWCFRRPFHPNPLLEPGKYQHQQKCLVLLPGATFGVFPRLQVEGCPALGFSANRIKVGPLVLSQAVPPESTVGTWKIPALAKVPRIAPWSNFWRFSPDCLGLVPTASKSVCWCFRRPFHPNPLLEPGKYQHQQKCLVLLPGATFGVFPRLQVEGCPALGFSANRIKVGPLVLSQAVPPESTVGTWKIPASAKVPRFAPWSNFWRFPPDCKSRALLCLGFCANRIKVGLLVLSQAVPPKSTLEPGKYQR